MCVGNVNLETLPTTMVENALAVSHFKHEICSVLQYVLEFDTIVKESMKRISSWSVLHTR